MRQLISMLRSGTSVSQAIIQLRRESVWEIPILYRIWSLISKGELFSSALRLCAKEKATVPEQLLYLALSNPEKTLELSTRGLEKVLAFFVFLERHLRHERARTVQSRLQFFLLSGIIPLLLFSEFFIFPELVVSSLSQPVTLCFYLMSAIFFTGGFLLFYRLEGGTSALVFSHGRRMARSTQIRKEWRVSSRMLRGQKCLGSSSRDAQRPKLRDAINHYFFLCALEISVDAGLSFKQALCAAVVAAPGARLSEYAEVILEREKKGMTLAKAFEGLGDLGDSEKVLLLEQLGRMVSSTPDFTKFLRDTVSSEQEFLRDLAEEQVGILTVQLLIPLCLCHFPAALLMILAPVVHGILGL